ncbi:N-acetylmuramoyl-L-alanine amidase [Schnuerera sp. xch1]|uniref:N-acetylmuramoyl-L-alanine amidase family protein n=1 Tax=Schnuerera sp. xch1 TaxID=2874283 RepID=UPI001CBC7524|nr:N-acetylmuramoyl-L-alanine amidase [Schnuerera sp. xch1]MBZ2174647.1 N-acetylmuramoyl-L-alanine amidase [Schnuerera sp. xch1]
MNKRVKRRVRFIGIVSLLILIFLTWNNNIQGDTNKQDDDKGLDTTEETFKVVIDPGHGGKDVGATGTSSLYEKDFTLSLSKKVNEILEKEEKIEVYMTREDDTFISTEDKYRAKFANELDADLYISIHGNTFESPNVSGTESYYYHEKFKSFAEIMHKNVVSSTGFNDRGVRKKDLFVVRYTDMPSVLLEIGYLTNPQEEQIMLNDEFQYSVAESICDGVKEYLEIE